MEDIVKFLQSQNFIPESVCVATQKQEFLECSTLGAKAGAAKLCSHECRTAHTSRAQTIQALKKSHYSSQVSAWEPSQGNYTIVCLKTDVANLYSGIRCSWVRSNFKVLRPLGLFMKVPWSSSL